MLGFSFRRIFPKGLYARSALLSLVPILVVLALMTIYYFYGHLTTVNTKLSQGVARQVSLIVETCRVDIDNRSAHASIAQRLNIIFECDFQPTPTDEGLETRFYYAGLIREQLDTILGVNTQLFLVNEERQLDVRVPYDERILQVILDRKRAVDINGHIFIVWVALVSLFMTLTALAFLRNHVRSILRLTEAAQAFGRGQEVEGFRPSGAREVRAAANAVIEMRRRLTRFAEQRTMMLAGVSHDLRTPLTRLQLQLAMQEQTEDVKAARADIRDMEAMLEEYLAFAQGADGEQAAQVDLAVLLGELVGKFKAARIVTDLPDHALITGRPLALKRAISNLLQNADTYGNATEVRIQANADQVEIIIDDDGPGIPEEKYKDAFRPFSRLDNARSQNVPGVGLGLALTRDTARGHGGSITLDRSPLGGLRATLVLPV